MAAVAAQGDERVGMPFWIHQTVEYLMALIVLSQGVQAGVPVPAGIAAGALVLLAATAHGPLGAFRIVRRPVHRIADIVVAVALAVLALLSRNEIGTGGLVLLGGSAAVLLLLVWRTSYAEPRKRQMPTLPSNAEDFGRSAGRLVGKGIVTGKALKAQRNRQQQSDR